MKRSKAKSRARRRTEHAYVLDAYKRLRALGIPSRREAPLLGRSVDLVYFHDGDFITVEFKLGNWRRAIGQARDHRIGSDYSFICLPRVNVSAELEAEAKRAGVGLYFFLDEAAWPFITAINALRSTIVSPFARESLSLLLGTEAT